MPHVASRQLSLMLGLVSSVSLAVPQTVRIQGTLANSDGTGLSATRWIQVALYSVASGGSALWESTSENVTVTSGSFALDLPASSGSPSLVTALASMSSTDYAFFEIRVDAQATIPRFKTSLESFAIAASSVGRLHTYPISTALPNANEVLRWNGSTWAGGSLAGASASGVTGPDSYTNLALARIAGNDGMSIKSSNVIYNGSNILYVPGTLDFATVKTTSGSVTANRLTRSNGQRLYSSGSTITDAQLARLEGVTGDIQAQILSKQPNFTQGNLATTSPALALSGPTGALAGGVTLAVATATASVSGILRSTDWNTFNAKQAPLSPGAANEVLRIPSSGTTPSWGPMALNQNNAITGILPVENGGTGATTQVQAIKNLSPLSAQGELIVHNGTAAAVLPAGSPGSALTADSSAAQGVKWQSTGATGLPSGTIISFGGIAAPPGWLLCDGSSYSRATYSNLFAAIGTAWGTADGSSFNVPDLRGRFLRGRDGGTGRDPEAGSRTASNTGGNTGDAVGSVQSDQFASHSHTYLYGAALVSGVAIGSGGTTGPAAVANNTSASGGSETRPKNLNVNFIIKQ